MPQTTLADVLVYLRKACAAHAARDLSDGELLQHFLADREQAAFTILVQRHGPLVLSVCQRLLGNDHSAEDAFQATFLVLFRRAASIRKEPLANWLYAVARRIALRARPQAAARRERERLTEPMPSAEPLDELTWQELRCVLDEEIGRLPAKYRDPIVLCYLAGKSYDLAARELGWSKSTLAKRLERARELLRHQLTQRGVALSMGLLATALGQKAKGAPVAAMLTIRTAKLVTSSAGGKAAVGGQLSAAAIALADEAIKGMVGIKGMLVLTVVAVGFAVGGAGLAGYGACTGKVQTAKAQEVRTPQPRSKKLEIADKETPPAVDHYGDLLPEGAAARLGTTRFRHNAPLETVAFSPDGKVLAAASHFNFGLSLWDAATGRLLHRLNDLDFGGSLSFSPDGQTLTTGPNCTQIDVATGKALRRLKGGLSIERFAFSPDGRTAATRDENGPTKVDVVDIGTGEVLGSLIGHTGTVYSFAFSPDGKTLASASEDMTVRIWDVATSKELRRFERDKPLEQFQSIAVGKTKIGYKVAYAPVAFSPDGKLLASAGEDGVIFLWDPAAGKLVHRLTGAMGALSTLDFSPDGKLLASAGYNRGTIRLWDPSTGKQLRTWEANPGRITSVAFSPDSRVLASTGVGSSGVRLWKTGSGTERDAVAAHTGPVLTASFAADGKTLFSCGADNRVLAWELGSGRKQGNLVDVPFWPAEPLWYGYPLDLSPKGKVLAQRIHPWGAQYSAIRIWDTVSGKPLGTLQADWAEVHSARFSPDGRLLASTATDGIRLWELATGKELYHPPGRLAEFTTAAFSSGGKLLTWVGEDKTIRLWDVDAGKERRRWESLQENVRLLVFSPDGRALASEGDGSVRVWATDTGRQLKQFGQGRGESGWSFFFRSVAFSPSGRILAAAGWGHHLGVAGLWNSGIYLWDVHSGQEIRRIQTSQGHVQALAFAPDGRTLASCGDDSTIVLWDLTGRLATGKPKSAAPTAAELNALWDDLAGDAPQADQAIWALARAPKQALPLLRDRLQPAKALASDIVAKEVSNLDSERFAVRQQAVQALEKMGEGAEGALRKVLELNPPLEVRQRLEQILAKQSKEEIRKLRALETLEHIGTPQARQVLELLAKECPNPRVADAAAAALRRFQE